MVTGNEPLPLEEIAKENFHGKVWGEDEERIIGQGLSGEFDHDGARDPAGCKLLRCCDGRKPCLTYVPRGQRKHLPSTSSRVAYHAQSHRGPGAEEDQNISTASC